MPAQTPEPGARRLGPGRALAIACLAGVVSSGCANLGSWWEPAIHIFPAKRIVTMDPARPDATAVAVEGDTVVGLGTLASLEQKYAERRHRVDRRFADKVILPGFIEPHLHPYIAGILLPMHFITPHDWDLPGRPVTGVRGRADYLARLAEVETELDEEDWLWTWGFHHLFHGRLTRADLDAISNTRPIIVWHRSFHEVIVNSAALEALDIDAAEVRTVRGVDLENGHFYEGGMEHLIPALRPHLFSLRGYLGALREARNILHAGGITTVSDGAFGTIDLDTEWLALRLSSWNRRDTPFRTVLLADGRTLGALYGYEAAAEKIQELGSRDTARVRFRTDAVKLFADGAFFSQLMQLGPPGYLDGHEGEWLMTPDELREAARPYWRAGLQIHVHANGDAGIDATLDVLDDLQAETPRVDHRFALHHFGYSRPDQIERVARSGVHVSANPFYVWALADLYSEVGLGPERASVLVRAGSLARAGVPLSLHSDFTMAPAQPLRLAWVAANRITADGNVVGPEERVALDTALRAITIDAAKLLRMEDEIGSIEPGKRADFTVLEADPYAVPIEELADIPIWGTVFEGTPYPLEAAKH